MAVRTEIMRYGIARPFKLGQYLNCKSKGVIYVIQCGCPLQYVGETKIMLPHRIPKHLSTIRLAERDIAQGKIPPPEAAHLSCKHILRQKELRWIYWLHSLFPVG